MKIAYVEDDVDSMTVFSEKFRRDGYQCDVFENSEEALPEIVKGAYDALVVDICLPGVSGIELLSKLRASQIFAPCVLITAFNSLPLAKQALNASANYLLEKPFTYKSLRQVIEKVTQDPSPLQLHAERQLKRFLLTPREEEIARLLLKGFSNPEMAGLLKLSEKTVKQYVSQIFVKADVKTRTELFSSIFPV
jgi:two-component system response regulator FixJ